MLSLSSSHDKNMTSTTDETTGGTYTQMFPHGCRDHHTWGNTTGSYHSCSSEHLCPHCHCLHLSRLMEAPWRMTAASWWWYLEDAQPAGCGPSLLVATHVSTKYLKVEVISQNQKLQSNFKASVPNIHNLLQNPCLQNGHYSGNKTPVNGNEYICFAKELYNPCKLENILIFLTIFAYGLRVLDGQKPSNGSCSPPHTRHVSGY